MATYFFLFILGIFFGSFINVVSLRYSPGQRLLDFKAIGGRSQCLFCRQKLNWYELVPIFSFLFQRGKCRRCGNKISFQYPLVEILSGLLFAGIYWRLNIFYFSIFNFQSITQLLNYQITNYLIIIIWILIFLLFLLLSIVDVRHYLIPDSINLSLAVLGFLLIIFKFISHFSLPITSFLGHYALLFNPSENIWLNHFLAALLSAAFFAAIILITRGKAMGWGDVKLGGALGLIFGFPDIIMVLALSFIIGTLFIAPFLASGKKKMKDIIPFGPFLIASAALVFFWGSQIINGYFKLFGIIL